MLDRELERNPWDQLETRHHAAGALLGEIEQRQRRVRRGHSDECGLHRTRPRKQLQDGGRDDAKRAFRPDEQMA